MSMRPDPRLTFHRRDVGRQIGLAMSVATDISITRTPAPMRCASTLTPGATGQEVRDHLRGDFAGVCRDAGRGDAVIAGEQHDPDALRRSRRTLALARRPARPRSPPAAPMRRPVWSASPAGPAPAPSRPRRVAEPARTSASTTVIGRPWRFECTHGLRAAMIAECPLRRTARRRYSAATRAFEAPSSSRNRRPLGYSGTTPEPTSLLTATTRPRVLRQAATKSSMAARTCARRPRRPHSCPTTHPRRPARASATA